MNSFDPTNIAAQEDEREAKQEQEALQREQEKNDLIWLMTEPRGRRIVWMLLARAGTFQSSFTGEALGTAFQEGGRNQGLQLLNSIIEHCPNRYLEMLLERNNDH